MFHPLPKAEPRDRLALARWIVDESNPLTARVIVNRFWEQIFGIGIVRTSEDFGSQGDLPTHPELLDWLATEFMASGWDVKALLKFLVTSSTLLPKFESDSRPAGAKIPTICCWGAAHGSALLPRKCGIRRSARAGC